MSFIEGGIGDTIDLFSEFSLKLLYILCIYIYVWVSFRLEIINIINWIELQPIESINYEHVLQT